MAKYKVKEEFNLNGIIRKVDDIIELDFRLANLKSVQGKIEKIPDNVVLKDTSVLGNVVPGTPLTPEQKEKLAKENLAESVEAQRLSLSFDIDILTCFGYPPYSVSNSEFVPI